MQTEKYKWIFFDMGGVILNDDEPERLRQQALLKVAQHYMPSVTMDDVNNAWMEASKIKGNLRIEALRVLFKNSPKLQEAEQEYTEACKYNYHELSTIRPEAKSVLEQLSQRYNLGITANQSEKTIELLEASGLLVFFSHQKMSAHIGLEKPDPNFFLTVLEDTGAKPSESVIVDDNWLRGLAPAKQLGMTTVLLKRDFIPYPNTAAPDFTIDNLTELLNLF